MHRFRLFIHRGAHGAEHSATSMLRKLVRLHYVRTIDTITISRLQAARRVLRLHPGYSDAVDTVEILINGLEDGGGVRMERR